VSEIAQDTACLELLHTKELGRNDELPRAGDSLLLICLGGAHFASLASVEAGRGGKVALWGLGGLCGSVTLSKPGLQEQGVSFSPFLTTRCPCGCCPWVGGEEELPGGLARPTGSFHVSWGSVRAMLL